MGHLKKIGATKEVTFLILQSVMRGLRPRMTCLYISLDKNVC